MQRLGYINIKGTSEVNSKKIILGSSLVAWWLEFQAFTVVMQVLPLVEGLIFSKMCGLAKKKKKIILEHIIRGRGEESGESVTWESKTRECQDIDKKVKCRRKSD